MKHMMSMQCSTPYMAWTCCQHGNGQLNMFKKLIKQLKGVTPTDFFIDLSLASRWVARPKGRNLLTPNLWLLIRFQTEQGLLIHASRRTQVRPIRASTLCNKTQVKTIHRKEKRSGRNKRKQVCVETTWSEKCGNDIKLDVIGHAKGKKAEAVSWDFEYKHFQFNSELNWQLLAIFTHFINDFLLTGFVCLCTK